jgi:hypothetical protein
MLIRVFAGLMLTLLIQLPLNSPLGAATLYTWNTGNGSWHIANNWNPAVIPNSPYHLAWIRHPTQNVTVSLNSSAVVGGLEIDTGNALQVANSVSMHFGQPGGTTTIINNGIIHLNSSGSPTYFQNDGDNATLTGLGKLVLGGNLNNIISGSPFKNDLNHAIEGGGTINSLFWNLGKVIANNGILKITGGVGSAEGSEASLGSMGNGNVLYLQCDVTGGKLQPNDGKIVLAGAQLAMINIEDGQLDVEDGDAAFITDITLSAKAELNVQDGHNLACVGLGPVINNGTIRLNSVGNNTAMVISGEMNGSGRIMLNGNSNNVLGGNDFIHGETHTIEGGGFIMASFENKGNVTANNNVLTISGMITGNGNFHVSDNATLNLFGGYDLQIGNFSMDRLATLNISDSKVIDLKKNFSFSQTDTAKWVGGDYITLQMSGDGSAPQSLEVGGKDLLAVANGFNNNFNFARLTIMGENTYVLLVDSIDNGHRASAEALYVPFLDVNPGSTLNLNRIHLYTYFDGEVHRVIAGEGDMFGGGNIIDKPERKVALPFLNLLLD